MQKLYSYQKSKSEPLKPKESTIEFLLSYSKALSVMNTKSGKFDNILN